VSTVATLTPAATVFREEQNFPWWLYALLAAWAALSCLAPSFARGVFDLPADQPRPGLLEFPLISVVGLSLPLVLVIGVLRMTTEVTPTRVRVWFGWLPTYRHEVVLSDVLRVEVVRYRPLADYGFWGVRRGKDGERVLNARGNRGVRLYLADESKLLIGSQRPEELALYLEKTIRPVP
jgi:hypothetical protein